MNHEPTIVSQQILEELKAREPVFHHPDKFGTTKEAILAQMGEEFREVGASGRVYTKQFVVDLLINRYQDKDFQDIWSTKNFEMSMVAPDTYLLTYVLIQNKTRHTRRVSLWQYVAKQWKILFHQGTLIEQFDQN